MKSSVLLYAAMLNASLTMAIGNLEMHRVDQLLTEADSVLKLQDYEKAEFKLKEALEISNHENYVMGQASCYRLLGLCAEFQFDYERAYKNYLQSLTYWESIPDSIEMAMVCRDLSLAKEAEGDYLGQEKFAKRGHSIFRSLKDTSGMGKLAVDLANALKNQGENDRAIGYYRQAITFLTRAGNSLSAAIARYNLSELHYQEMELGLAEEMILKAIPVFDDEHETAKVAQAYNLIGAIQASKKSYSNALGYYKKSASLAEKVENRLLEFDALLNLAQIETFTGHRKEAERYFRMAEKCIGDFASREDNLALDKIAFGIRVLKLTRVRRNWIIATSSLTVLLALLILRLYLMRQKHKLRQKNHEFILRQNQLRHEKDILDLFRMIDQKASQARETAEKEERKKLKDLVHNNIGSQLAATRWNIESCMSALAKNELEVKDLENIWQMIDKGYKNSRNIETLLDKDRSSWFLEISNFFKLLSKKQKSKPEIHFLNHSHVNTISPKKGKLIYEIVQIATANTLIHADANHLTCQINKVEDEIIIIIEDDGKGFDASDKFNGVGINNIKDLVAQLDGQQQIDSHLGKGTTISITIPI